MMVLELLMVVKGNLDKEFQMEAKQPHVTPESKQALKELDESPASGWLASTVAAVAAGMSVVGEP